MLGNIGPIFNGSPRGLQHCLSELGAQRGGPTKSWGSWEVGEVLPIREEREK